MSKKETYEAKTEQLLTPIAGRFGVEIYDVEYVREGSDWYLRAYIDKPEGVNITDCENVSRALSDVLDEEDFIADLDCITCVPMRRKNIQKRGYNQTKLLAKEISGLLGLPFVPLLKKTKDTLEQKSLSAEGRRVNVKGAFSVASKHYDLNGKNILIIDDVCTTGSTLSENARTLKSAGASRVFAAVIEKTTLDHI